MQALDLRRVLRRRRWGRQCHIHPEVSFLENGLALRADDARVEPEPMHTAHVPRMLDFHAAVDDYVQATLGGNPGTLGADHAELEPECARADAHGFGGNPRHSRWSAEH